MLASSLLILFLSASLLLPVAITSSLRHYKLCHIDVIVDSQFRMSVMKTDSPRIASPNFAMVTTSDLFSKIQSRKRERERERNEEKEG